MPSLASAEARPQRGELGYRTLLVHVQADESAAPRLRAAAALAGRLDATLFGLGAEMVPPLGAVDPTGMLQGDWYVEMRDQVQARLQRAQEAFRAETEGLKTEWAWVQDMPADAVARASRGADLIVAGGVSAKNGDRYRACDPAELMLHSGRPVLVVPPAGGELRAKAVVVAWKDTRESRRALADATPLLAAADTVLVVEVCGKDDADDAQLRTDAVVRGLQRRRVSAESRVVVAPPEGVAAELDIAARAIGADLVVAGGYGHTRLGEWVFGGVTRDLLNQPGRFVLLSH